MISRSRLWSNFLHWRTNQFVSFHKFPQKNICFLLLKFIPSRLAGSYIFAIRYIRLRSKSSNTECLQTQYFSDLLFRKDDPDPPSIWWVSSAALPFQGVVHLPVQVFRTSTARVISWYFRWWCLSCAFLRGLECLSRRCPLLWHLKHKPNFSYNYHRSLTIDSSRFHTMPVHVFLSSQNITWVFACSFSWATSICLNLTWVSLVQDSLNYWSNQRLSLRLDSRFQPLI